MDRALPDSFRRRRRVRGALQATALVVLAWALLAWLPRALRPGVDRAAVRTAVVERGDVTGVVATTGRAVPAAETALSSPVEARVLRVLRRPGERVEAGDEIVVLDTEASRLELERLDERAARKASERLERSLRREREVGTLASEARAAELDLELARYRLEQRRALHRQGLVAEAALREAEVEERKAVVEVERLEATLAATRREADAALAALDLETGLVAKEREAAARRLRQATARAEGPGVVSWVVAEEGRTVARGEVLARVADLTSYRVEATAADLHAGVLAIGQAARVELGDVVLAGTVGRIFPTIEEGAVRFVVDLADPRHPALRSQRRLAVEVVTEERSGVLRVRRGPFARGGRAEVVFVVDGDVALRREVEIGLVGADHVEVRHGLAAGDEVIVSDLSDLVHAERVRLR